LVLSLPTKHNPWGRLPHPNSTVIKILDFGLSHLGGFQGTVQHSRK
jgi:hypothetical protein